MLMVSIVKLHATQIIMFEMTDTASDEWIAVISGLSVGSSDSPDASLQMLIEYLAGEEGGIEDRQVAAQISRIIIAGNSFAPMAPSKPDVVKGVAEDEKKAVSSFFW